MYTILPASRYIVFHTAQKLFMSRGSFDFCGKEKRKQCAVNIFFISKVFLALHMREEILKLLILELISKQRSGSVQTGSKKLSMGPSDVFV